MRILQLSVTFESRNIIPPSRSGLSLYTIRHFFSHVWRILHVLVHCQHLHRDRSMVLFLYTKLSHC
jgi:hypothetical protein